MTSRRWASSSTKLSGVTPQEVRLSRDERLAYFNISNQDIDVWMVTLPGAATAGNR